LIEQAFVGATRRLLRMPERASFMASRLSLGTHIRCQSLRPGRHDPKAPILMKIGDDHDDALRRMSTRSMSRQ
jgi:hypothetical protein